MRHFSNEDLCLHRYSTLTLKSIGINIKTTEKHSCDKKKRNRSLIFKDMDILYLSGVIFI